MTVNDINKIEGKIFTPIEVVSTVISDANSKLRKSIIENAIKILKTSKLFNVDEKHHLDFEKRKECEKIISGVIDGNHIIAHLLINVYKHSKKLFIHSINVGIISLIIDLALQEIEKHHDGLRSEIVLTGGLLHDIGFIGLHSTLVNKLRIDYDGKEEKIYKTYPDAGKKMLIKYKNNVRSEVIKIIYQHQERLNGSGFPNELHDIYELALIIGLADEFDLTISGEITNTQKSPQEIMSKISKMSNAFGENIINSFYRSFRYLT